MARQDVDHGTVAGDGTGENLFDAFSKVNANFTELYANWVALANTATGEGASDVGIEDAAGNFAATNVEAALAEIFTRYADTANGEGASLVGVEDSAANFTGTTVEAILAEIISTLASTSNGDGAATVGIEDADDQLTATQAEAAIEEVAKFAMPSAAPSGYASIEADYITGGSTSLPVNSGAVRVRASADCVIRFDQDEEIFMPRGTEVFGASGKATLSARGFGAPVLVHVTGLDSAYRYTLTTSTEVAIAAGANTVALPAGRMVRLTALSDCYIRFGTEGVVADNKSLFFEAGSEVMRVPSGATYISVMRYTTNSGLYISGVN